MYRTTLLTPDPVIEPDKGKGKEYDEDENTSRSSEPTDSDVSGSDNRYGLKVLFELSSMYLYEMLTTQKVFVVAGDENIVGGAPKQLSRRGIAKSLEGIVQIACVLLVLLKFTAHHAGIVESLGQDLNPSQGHPTGTPMECLIHLPPILLSLVGMGCLLFVLMTGLDEVLETEPKK